VTVPEVRRLLAIVLRDQAQHAFRLHWSRWRRKRQAEARRSHDKRRLAGSAQDVPL
jgi:hypothetical protein